MRFSKVFGIGLPRTGTTSLNTALNTIGISSVHFPFSLYETSDLRILDKYTGFVDSPIPFLYRQLDEMYPDAGFILTTRPSEQWLTSMQWLLEEGPKIWEWKPAYDTYHADLFGSPQFELECYQKAYDNFHLEVHGYFENRDNLLTLDLSVSYGYKELCSFLEVPVHEDEYPRGNKKRHARRLQSLARQVGRYNQPCEQLIRRLDYYILRLKELNLSR